MSENDSSQTMIYVASFVGMLGFLGIFGEVLRRKHRKEVQERDMLLEAVRQRQQQVIDENLPPFYVDHVRDPRVREEDVLPEAIITIPLEHRAGAPITTEEPSSSHPPIAAAAAGAATAIITVNNMSYHETVIVVPESAAAGLTALPPPPSYDVPNLTVERSPIMDADARMTSEGHLSLSSPSPIASGAPSRSSLPLTPDPQPTLEEQPLDAPRYSAEFPPHIPHERHLDNYRRSRALSDAALGPPLPQNLLTASSIEAVTV
ncbi:hypothetical protein EMPS_09098 [Entomortierella parvispora]|uniref:Uncharacterized protein n=1 Tax=Entomortierella parvispora TaxID=205924 RepID=A0A9P3HHB8_9FUNG|nr:hypothetical protein EMPS_09098 [Entomortierella parvispora]